MRLLAVLFLLCLPSIAHSASVVGLYKVSVPVENQSVTSRDLAVSEAYRQMLVRLSGRSNSLENDVLTQEAANAETHITSLSYQRDDEGTLSLIVNFNPASLRTLFEQAQAPVWGASRPALLIVMAVETESGERQVLSQGTEWEGIVSNALKVRGLPYLYPSWDLEDEITLPMEKLWGQFEQEIAALADRYPNEGLLTGRFWVNTDAQWRFSGYLRHAGEILPLRGSAETQQALALHIAGIAAETLSQRYAVTAGGSAANPGFRVQVSGVDNFQAYRALQDYLSARVGIRSVKMINAEADTVTLLLNLSGDWAQIWRVIELDQKLEQRPGDERLYWLP